MKKGRLKSGLIDHREDEALNGKIEKMDEKVTESELRKKMRKTAEGSHIGAEKSVESIMILAV